MLNAYICTNFIHTLKILLKVTGKFCITKEIFNPFRHPVDCASLSLLTDSCLKSDFLNTFLNIQRHLNLLQNGSIPLKFPPNTHANTTFKLLREKKHRSSALC